MEVGGGGQGGPAGSVPLHGERERAETMGLAGEWTVQLAEILRVEAMGGRSRLGPHSEAERG